MRERLRKLHFEGQEFTWTADIRAAPGAGGRRHRYIRVRVWGAGKNGCALQADMIELPAPAEPAKNTPAEPATNAPAEPVEKALAESVGSESAEKTYAYPSAAIVRQLIAWAQAAGWTPEKVGGTFRVSPVTGPALPGLALVEVP